MQRWGDQLQSLKDKEVPVFFCVSARALVQTNTLLMQKAIVIPGTGGIKLTTGSFSSCGIPCFLKSPGIWSSKWEMAHNVLLSQHCSILDSKAGNHWHKYLEIWRKKKKKEQLWMAPEILYKSQYLSSCTSSPGWVWLWASWFSGRCPCLWQGGGSGWSLKSLPS